MPKITIGLITYNRPKLLKRALESLLNQTYKDILIYIGNDYTKSNITHNSLNIKKTEKVKIFNYKKNIGERNNMNFLLKRSRTEWFTWLADDDYFHEKFIEQLFYQIQMHKKSNPVACFSNYSRIKLDHVIKKKKFPIYDKEEFINGFSKKKLRLIGTFGLIKTNILKKIKGIHATGKSFTINKKKTHHYPYCDTLVPILMSNHGKIIWVDQRLVYLNTDKNSISSYTTEYDAYISAEKYLLKKLNQVMKKGINDKNSIIVNFKNWFYFNRLNIIKKRNPFLNLLNIKKYINDTKKIYEYKGIEYNNSYINKNVYKIIKSIALSFKNII